MSHKCAAARSRHISRVHRPARLSASPVHGWTARVSMSDSKTIFDIPSDAQPVFHVFAPNSDTFRIMNLIWQLRHTIVHNVGVITRSDAAKLKGYTRRVLAPRGASRRAPSRRRCRPCGLAERTELGSRLGANAPALRSRPFGAFRTPLDFWRRRSSLHRESCSRRRTICDSSRLTWITKPKRSTKEQANGWLRF